MCKCWTAVVLQGTKDRISVDLIAPPGQKPAAIIAGEVVTKGADRATVVEEGSAASASI